METWISLNCAWVFRPCWQGRPWPGQARPGQAHRLCMMQIFQTRADRRNESGLCAHRTISSGALKFCYEWAAEIVPCFRQTSSQAALSSCCSFRVTVVWQPPVATRSSNKSLPSTFSHWLRSHNQLCHWPPTQLLCLLIVRSSRNNGGRQSWPTVVFSVVFSLGKGRAL